VAIPPSYLIRFTLIPLPDACAPHDRIPAPLLIAFAHVFTSLAQLRPRPNWGFAGTITRAGRAVYVSRLFAMGDKAARREKYKEVDAGDLGRLYEGRGGDCETDECEGFAGVFGE